MRLWNQVKTVVIRGIGLTIDLSYEAEPLKQGKLVAVPTKTVYGLSRKRTGHVSCWENIWC